MNAGGSPEARRADGADSTDAPDGARLTWGMRRWKGGSVARRPGLVIAGRARAAALREGRAGRTIGERRAGQIRPVRLLPFAWRVAFLQSAARRRCDASSHARTAGWSRPRHSRCRSPSAARSRARDRSCRPWCGNNGCRTRRSPTARRNSQVQTWVPKVCEFHQVNSLQQETFHGTRAVGEGAFCHLARPRCKARARGARRVPVNS